MKRKTLNLFFFCGEMVVSCKWLRLFPEEIPPQPLVLFGGSEPWKTLNLSMWMEQRRPLLVGPV